MIMARHMKKIYDLSGDTIGKSSISHKRKGDILMCFRVSEVYIHSQCRFLMKKIFYYCCSSLMNVSLH